MTWPSVAEELDCLFVNMQSCFYLYYLLWLLKINI